MNVESVCAFSRRIAGTARWSNYFPSFRTAARADSLFFGENLDGDKGMLALFLPRSILPSSLRAKTPSLL